MLLLNHLTRVQISNSYIIKSLKTVPRWTFCIHEQMDALGMEPCCSDGEAMEPLQSSAYVCPCKKTEIRSVASVNPVDHSVNYWAWGFMPNSKCVESQKCQWTGTPKVQLTPQGKTLSPLAPKMFPNCDYHQNFQQNQLEPKQSMCNKIKQNLRGVYKSLNGTLIENEPSKIMSRSISLLSFLQLCHYKN